jgi:hypothetical protein
VKKVGCIDLDSLRAGANSVPCIHLHSLPPATTERVHLRTVLPPLSPGFRGRREPEGFNIIERRGHNDRNESRRRRWARLPGQGEGRKNAKENVTRSGGREGVSDSAPRKAQNV